MLGQIDNYCPTISRNSIIRNSISLADIWQTIRLHYGFQSTGAQFLDFTDLRLEQVERPEDLYQRIVAFVEDNLLLKGSSIKHHGEASEEDEEMTPSFENIITLTWLKLIHGELPKLVKQRYGTELRSRTLATIKPEISLALPSLLDELQCSEDSRDLRASFRASPTRSGGYRKHDTVFRKKAPVTSSYRPTKICPLCREAGRISSHYLSKCTYLPEADKRFLSRARSIEVEELLCDGQEFCGEAEAPQEEVQQTYRFVQVEQSPYLNCFHGHVPVQVILDFRATGNKI